MRVYLFLQTMESGLESAIISDSLEYGSKYGVRCWKPLPGNDTVCAVIHFSVRELVRAIQLLVVTICKWPINP
jgi:hypothetical protein